MVPMSVRAEAERGALGNRVTAMYAPLPVHLADPVERFEVVHEAMKGLKESGQAVGAELITQLAGFAPPTVLSQASRLQSSQRVFNVVVTNVPGPAVPALHPRAAPAAHLSAGPARHEHRARDRDHVLRRHDQLRAARRLRRAAGPRRPRRRAARRDRRARGRGRRRARQRPRAARSGGAPARAASAAAPSAGCSRSSSASRRWAAASCCCSRATTRGSRRRPGRASGSRRAAPAAPAPVAHDGAPLSRDQLAPRAGARQRRAPLPRDAAAARAAGSSRRSSPARSTPRSPRPARP